MTLVALALSLSIAALGALGVVSPARLLGVVSRFQTPAGLYAAAAIRIVLGSALVVAAPDSRAPDVLPVLGVFIVFAGLVTPLFGGCSRGGRRRGRRSSGGGQPSPFCSGSLSPTPWLPR
jgi:predicted lysophospholipase L1 biosynthesis ABC-type transport system permease subunit